MRGPGTTRAVAAEPRGGGGGRAAGAPPAAPTGAQSTRLGRRLGTEKGARPLPAGP